MALFEQFPYTNFHELNVDWVIKKTVENSKNSEKQDVKIEKLESDFKGLESDVDYKLSNLNVSEVIDEMYINGDFEPIFERILKDFQFTQPELFNDYTTLAEYYETLDALAETSDWLQSINIGTSVMGTPIKCYVIGKSRNGEFYRNGLVFGNQHAREYQSVYVLANAITMIVNNLENNTGSIKGIEFEKLFSGYKLFVVPCANPDGYKLCVENYYAELPAERKTEIANMITDFVRGGYVNENDFTPEEINEILNEFGSFENYEFRESDVAHLWNANINGIDLHYNCFTSVNESIIRAHASANNFPNAPAPRNYIGANGFECPENTAIKTLIESNGITSVYDMHQRGPTMFFQYKYGGQKFARSLYISQEIANATRTPVSQANNGLVGFMGWYHATYKSNDYYGCIKEVGWSRRDILINGASNPLDTAGYMTNPMPRDLQKRVYEREIYGILAYMYYAICNMAINQFKNSLAISDVASQTPNNLTDAQILVDVAFAQSNFAYKRTILSTNKTLSEICAETTRDGMIVLLQPSDTNTPNIKLAGTSVQNKIFILKQGSTSIAYQIATNGNIWSCVITASTSTNWRLINAKSGTTTITATEQGATATIDATCYYQPIITATASNFDVNVRCGYAPQNNYNTCIIGAKGTGSTTVHWSITSIEYPSV